MCECAQHHRNPSDTPTAHCGHRRHADRERKAYGDTDSVERGWSSGGRSSNEQPTSKPVIAAKIGSKRCSKLQCNFNYIRVRSFILTGAPPTLLAAHRLFSWLAFTRMWPSLDVKPQEVIPGQTESADRWLACEANMRPVPVVAMEPSGQRGPSISPLRIAVIGPRQSIIVAPAPHPPCTPQ